MFKNIILLLVTTILTLLLALGAIRLIAPELLGVKNPIDLQVVQVDKKVPPFYENIFREQDMLSQTFIIQDPITKTRFLPFFPINDLIGPHDILGFRNWSVPNRADIITIGDSQTYGNNAPIFDSWPYQMQDYLKDENPTVYSMAIGGWGAVQYLNMFYKALYFRPKVIIIAYYTGNDASESFLTTYGIKNWHYLKPNPHLSLKDAPPSYFPPDIKDVWEVKFQDKIKTVFTPKTRLAANFDHAAINAGYEIMAKTAEIMATEIKQHGFQIKLVFTIIPTKELVFEKKLQQENLEWPDNYKKLLQFEKERIAKLSKELQKYGQYVNLVNVLQEAALEPVVLYPNTVNGHPFYLGYKVIGENIAKEIQPYFTKFLTAKENTLVVVPYIDKKHAYFVLSENNTLYPLLNKAHTLLNGWENKAPQKLLSRDLLKYTIKPTLDYRTIEPKTLGPVN